MLENVHLDGGVPQMPHMDGGVVPGQMTHMDGGVVPPQMRPPPVLLVQEPSEQDQHMMHINPR